MLQKWILMMVLTTLPLLAAVADNPDTLKVALLPDEDAATIIKKHQVFKAYLERVLDKKIELIVTTDYSSMVEAMRHARIDLGYFGPFSYIMAKSKSNIEAFAAKSTQGTPHYQALLIVNAEKGISHYADIKGYDVAYGDPASTSSHLIPKSMLLAAGLRAGVDYNQHFLGAHDAVAMAVQRGHAAVGGLSKPIFETLIARGLIDARKVVVFAESKPFPQYPWVMRSDLDEVLKAQIRDAFYTLKDKQVLAAFKADGMVAVSDADYDVVRQLKHELKL
ncbi:MAG: phosphate/phosphite/phosphonate ABC transporter substrate-binding protein [Gammaproteobacteria bacterium]|nr:phosphate/phosphite/phosphonate ABC transporter substrate-binding protein [Gammaproteobacteria bacterium]